MSTAVVGSVLDSIRSGLVAVTALKDVNVFSGPVPLDEAGLECVAFGDARLAEEPAAMGGEREERWTVDGEIRVLKSWEGTTETTIAAARTRALAIYAAVETYINDTYTGSLPDVSMSDGELRQSYLPDGRVCSVLFSVLIVQLKNP
jgi:hypothetical protein